MANWWQENPIRLIQTNLREIDVRRDPREIVREVHDMGGNAILFSVGGIVSFYPTRLRFQTPIPLLKGEAALSQTPLYRSALDDNAPVRDFVGPALDEARRLGLHFIARLDLSKCHKHVYESRPEWFFRRVDGQPQVYNGLYSTCVNGGYYQEYAFEIMAEIAERYAIDAFFFNMFGYHSTDYSGNYHGLCQCDNCQRRFRELFGQPLPQAADLKNDAYLDYIAFRRITANDLTQRVANWIHGHNLAMVNFQVQFADMVRSESNTAVDRPLPEWQFSASDNVKRVRGTFPDKPSCNAAVYFVDIPYRFASVPPQQNALRLAQDIAHGGDIDLYVLGTLQQEDRQSLAPAREIYAFARQHQEIYRGMRSAAQTCLLYPQRSYDYNQSTSAAYRGAFRILTENHILFDCAHDLILDMPQAGDFLGRYRLLILPDVACISDGQAAAIDEFVRRGGRVLATGGTALYTELGRPRTAFGLQSLGAARVKTIRPSMRSAYLRMGEAARMAGMPDTDLIFLDGPYWVAELRSTAETSLTLVPPCMYGPPEQVAIDQVESDLPGIIWHTCGQGRTAYLPWQVDSLYYRHSSPGHSGALMSALLALLPERQIMTDAGSQVELALFKGERGYLLNLVNVSGHHGTAYFPPVPMHGLEVQVRLPQPASSAHSLQMDKPLALWQADGYTGVRLERLDLWDTIQLV